MAIMQKFRRYVLNKISIPVYVEYKKTHFVKNTFICTDSSKMHNDMIILFFIETGKLQPQCILYCSK